MFWFQKVRRVGVGLGGRGRAEAPHHFIRVPLWVVPHSSFDKCLRIEASGTLKWGIIEDMDSAGTSVATAIHKRKSYTNRYSVYASIAIPFASFGSGLIKYLTSIFPNCVFKNMMMDRPGSPRRTHRHRVMVSPSASQQSCLLHEIWNGFGAAGKEARLSVAAAFHSFDKRNINVLIYFCIRQDAATAVAWNCIFV